MRRSGEDEGRRDRVRCIDIDESMEQRTFDAIAPFQGNGDVVLMNFKMLCNRCHLHRSYLLPLSYASHIRNARHACALPVESSLRYRHHTTTPPHLSLLASRSDSSKQRMSSSLTVLLSDVSACILPHCKPSHRLTWALDVPDNASGRVVHEFNAHLRHTTSRAWSHRCQYAGR